MDTNIGELPPIILPMTQPIFLPQPIVKSCKSTKKDLCSCNQGDIECNCDCKCKCEFVEICPETNKQEVINFI